MATSQDSTWALMNYFVYHPKMTMSQKCDPRERQMLMASLKRMKAKGLADADIRKAIDRFYARPSGSNEHPIPHFLNKNFQAELTQDMRTVKLGHRYGPFVANGFERSDGMDLPWEEQYDGEIKMRCLRDPESMWDIIKEYE
jgi:hypothetical protein